MVWETAEGLPQVQPALSTKQYEVKQYEMSQRAILVEINHLFFQNIILFI